MIRVHENNKIPSITFSTDFSKCLRCKPIKILDRPGLQNQKDKFCLDQAQHMFLPWENNE